MATPSPLAALLRRLFGRLTWERPPWVAAVGPLARRSAPALGLLAVLGGLGGGLLYWNAHRPPPPDTVQLSARLTAPSPPPRRPRTAPVPPPEPLQVEFDGSAAPLDALNQPVTRSVTLSPALEGQWTWTTERTLTFTPRQAWPIGQHYTVALAPELVARPHTVLVSRELTFDTEPFSAQVVVSDFYQDPVDPKLKQVLATVRFTYPADVRSFESKVRLTSSPVSNQTLQSAHQVSVVWDDLHFEATVRSEALPLPLEDHLALFTIGPGTGPEAPGKPLEQPLTAHATIPGKGNRFKVQQASVAIARSAEGDPDQVLVFQCTSPVDERRFAAAVKVWRLPPDRPASPGRPAVAHHRWTSAEVGPEVLKRAVRVGPTPIPGEREVGEVQSFKLDSKPATQLFVRVEAGVEAYGGFVLLKPFEAVLEVPEYPRELRLAHEGALLSVTGDRKLTVVARGLTGFRARLFRVLPKDLNHLVSQSSGDFAHQTLQGSFTPQDLSEVFTEVQRLDASDPRAAQYAAIDFTPHLKEGLEQRGMYFVEVEAWDPDRNQAVTQATRSDEPPPPAPDAEEAVETVDREGGGAQDGEPGEAEHGDEGEPAAAWQLADRRFVVLTDLGLIDKVDALEGHWVYVQSFRSGGPVAGAQVEVLARNGTVVLRRTTDAQGVATLPPLTDFTAERAPVALVAREGSDVSFLPLRKLIPAVDLSRFDVGGVRTKGRGGALTAYAFSDRGLYRPGETAHLSAIIRAVDWSRGVEGLPLELAVVDPRGLAVKRQKVKLDALGFVSLDFRPEDSAPTGTYTLEVSVAQANRSPVALGGTSFRVEEFLPDRLKLTTRFLEAAPGWVTGLGVTAEVELQNLFGTPAAGHAIAASYTLSPWTPRFSQYPDFRFFDPSSSDRSESRALEEQTADAQGRARWTLNLADRAKASASIRFFAEGKELGGGRSVTGLASVVVSPRTFLVGFKPDGDLGFIPHRTARRVQLLAVGPTLQPVPVEKLKVVLVEQRYVSVLTRESSGSYRYQSVQKDLTRSTAPLALGAQGQWLTLPSDQVGAFFYSVRDLDDVELARIPFTVAGEGNLARDLERNAELKVVLDKKDYEVGEAIQVQVTAPYAGAGVITIERDKVYAHLPFKTTTTSTVQSLRVPPGLEVNGYVHVAFVRALDSKELYVSPLSSGVVPFTLSRKKQQLQVSVEAEALARPGRPLAIRYRTDRPARIAVFAVDEGILQVARHETPDPLGFFLARRALEVTTRQIVDLLLPEFSLVHARGHEGGDAEGKALAGNLNPFKRKGDPPAVFWSGLLEAGPESRTVSFDVPESFAGTLRLMAVAAAPDALGASSGHTVVRGPFVISPSAPTFAAPGDTFTVTAAIANNVEGSGPKAALEVQLTPNASFTVTAPATRRLEVPEGQEGLVSFQVTATSVLGAGELAFRVSGGRQEATRTAHVSVRPASPYAVDTQVGSLKGRTVELTPRRALFDQLATRELLVSALPLGLAAGTVEYLEQYPHLCSEQLSSRAVPALVFQKRPQWGYRPALAREALERAFSVLRARQNEQGQFGLWAANSVVSDPLDVYITLLLTEAWERGVAAPDDVRLKALGELRRLADEPLTDLGHAALRAQALYVLARNSVLLPGPTAQLADYLARARPAPPDRPAAQLASTWLAATDQLAHNAPAAKALLDGVTLLDEVPSDSTWYRDDLTYRAQVLYVVARHFPERLDRLGPALLERLVRHLSSSQGSLHSLSAGWTLYALDAYATAVEAGADGALQGVTVERKDARGAWAPVALTAGMTARVAFDGATAGLRVRSGDQLVFYSLVEGGFERTAPAAAQQEGVEVVHTLTDEAGQPVTAVTLGQEVLVHVRTRSLLPGQSLSQMAVVDLLPSGFDLVLAQGSDAQGLARLVSGTATWHPTQLDAREDRLVFYGDIRPEVGELTYRLKAVARGRFAVPPAFATGMYEPGRRGRSLGSVIEVR